MKDNVKIKPVDLSEFDRESQLDEDYVSENPNVSGVPDEELPVLKKKSSKGKFLLLLILALAAGAAFYLHKNDKLPKSMAELKAMDFASIFTKSEQPVLEEPKASPLDEFKVTFSEWKQKINSALFSTEQKVENLDENVTNLRSELNGKADSELLVSMEHGFRNSITHNKDEISVLQEKVELLEKRVFYKPKPAKTVAKPKPEEGLPFKVESIDMWGGKPFANIYHEGKSGSVGIGQDKVGFRVIQINYQSNEVVFKNLKTGNTFTEKAEL